MMMNKIKDWYLTKSQREKYTVIGGVALVVGLLFYSLVWLPLNASIEKSRHQFSSNQQLLSWMKNADARLESLGQNARRAQQVVSNVMVQAEQSLAKAKLARYLKQVQQPESKEVSISLQHIPFDEFIAWLQGLTNHYRIKVQQLQINKGSTFGTAQVQFTLKKY